MARVGFPAIAKKCYALYLLQLSCHKMEACVVVVFELNVLPIAKVIWRQGHGLYSHPTDW